MLHVITCERFASSWFFRLSLIFTSLPFSISKSASFSLSLIVSSLCTGLVDCVATGLLILFLHLLSICECNSSVTSFSTFICFSLRSNSSLSFATRTWSSVLLWRSYFISKISSFNWDICTCKSLDSAWLASKRFCKCSIIFWWSACKLYTRKKKKKSDNYYTYVNLAQMNDTPFF